MIEYYKEGSDTSGQIDNNRPNSLDDFTRYEFSFSGLQCRVLGEFYILKTSDQSEGECRRNEVEFGADLENFYSANNYSVYKASDAVLRKIVNQRDSGLGSGKPQ